MVTDSQPQPLSLPPILPAGTKVVARVAIRGVQGELSHAAGAVGVIVRSPVDPLHAYRVRFMDGFEVSLGRDEVVVLTHYQREAREGALVATPAYDFKQHVILRCVIGSRAYGLEQGGSDTDYRGVYLPPAEMEWSLWGVPEQIEEDATQEVYWELQKFLILALKAIRMCWSVCIRRWWRWRRRWGRSWWGCGRHFYRSWSIRLTTGM